MSHKIIYTFSCVYLKGETLPMFFVWLIHLQVNVQLLFCNSIKTKKNLVNVFWLKNWQGWSFHIWFSCSFDHHLRLVSNTLNHLHLHFTNSFFADFLSSKKLKTQTVNTKKLCKALLYKNAVRNKCW